MDIKGLVLIIFTLLIGCSRRPTEAPPVSGADHAILRESSSIQMKDIANDANDPSNLSDAEPSIAVNPLNPQEIAVVAFSEPWTPAAMAPVWKSRDGGSSWKKVPQIPHPPAPYDSLEGPADQKITFDAEGKLAVAELGFDPPRNFIYRQEGGADAPLTPGASYGDDQPHVVRGNNNGVCTNPLYTTWLKTAVGKARDRSMDSHSENAGATLTDVAVGNNDTFPNRTTRVAVAPDGKVYVVYKTREGSVNGDFETAHFRVKRSDDCGMTWNGIGGIQGEPVHGNPSVQTLFTDRFGNLSGKFDGNQKVARARSSDAWIAVAPASGDVFVAYVNKDNSGFAQVYVARSADRGVSWAAKRATDGTHHSGYPEISVAGNGTVGVLFIDYDDSGAHAVFRHHFARSFDGGGKWDDVILQSMDVSAIDNAATGFLWGDYEGLASAGNYFFGVFTGQSSNRAVIQLDPIFFKIPATR